MKTAASEAQEKDASGNVFVIKQEDNSPPIQLWSNNFLNNWFFIWVFPILAKSKRISHVTDYKFKLRQGETSRINVDALEEAWDASLEGGKPSIYQALKKVYGIEYWAIAGYKLTWTFFTWAGNQICLIKRCLVSSLKNDYSLGKIFYRTRV
jgi:hypothetical protein